MLFNKFIYIHNHTNIFHQTINSLKYQNFFKEYQWTIISRHTELAIILFILCGITIIGNLLVILSVIKVKKLRSATNYFITSLAFADCITGLLIMPLGAIYEILENHWIFSLYWCDIMRSIDVLLATASILSLCAISYDRYVAISQPFNYPSKITKKFSILLITIIWIISILISILSLVWWCMNYNNVPEYTCPFIKDIFYVLITTSISFYIPFFIMLFMYYKIYRKASDQAKDLKNGEKTISKKGSEGSINFNITLRIHRGGNNGGFINKNKEFSNNNFTTKNAESNTRPNFNNKPNSLRTKKFSNATKTICIIMGAFIICWSPYFLTDVYSSIFLSNFWKEDHIVYITVSWLGWINSGINPIIYSYWSKDFRR